MHLHTYAKPRISKFRDFSSSSQEKFLNKGYKKRYFFPHKTYFLPRCGPDGYKIANIMVGKTNPDQLWEVVLYAAGPLIDEFPEELYFDDDIIWHQQQLGKKGQVATANLVVIGNVLYGNNYLSDLVQRISRYRSFKTQVENRFKGWPYLLLNSVLNFALENDIDRIYSPTADFVLQHTDPIRKVQRDLFDRIYDLSVNKHFHARREGNWWLIDTAENRDKVVIADKKNETLDNEKSICFYHDIEKGLGHTGTDPNLAEFADNMSLKYLEEMLEIEERTEAKATYNVVGQILNEVRQLVGIKSNCLAFHSFDHKVSKIWSNLSRFPRLLAVAIGLISMSRLQPTGNQLRKCREVDYRLKGYHVPQSTLTGELVDNSLCFYNFEWLGYFMTRNENRWPRLENRIVKIPMQFDDFSMYAKGVKYGDWEKKALQLIEKSDFIAIGLHDCYGQYWLSHYESFLNKARDLGKLKTLNEVTDEVFMAHAL